MKNIFGNPDGSKTNFEESNLDDFIKFETTCSGVNQGLMDDFEKTRVIVGTKGSGKTVYLRRMRAAMIENKSVYTTDIQSRVPPTDLVIRFTQMFKTYNIEEEWSKLWRIAILSSLCTHILANNRWSEECKQVNKLDIIEFAEEGDLFQKRKNPSSIYSEAQRIMHQFTSMNDFNNYANDYRWDDLELSLQKCMRDMAPIYFFIDALDEAYAYAPMYWMQCQKGLFKRVMQFLYDPFWGNKLHVIICIRDNVWSSICMGEHHTRYINSDHIKMLIWDYPAIDYFLKKKVYNIPDEEFKDTDDKTLEKWLNTDSIHNHHRNISESLSQYIIRHTRLIPRDIVVVGNELAELKLYMKKIPSVDASNLIRERVSKCAKTFGEELLQICANQMNNNAMPGDAGMNEYTEVYTSISEYRDSTVQFMKNILRRVTSDKLTWEQIMEMEEEASQKIGTNANMFDILWQNVGIGYLEEGPNGRREVFFNQEIPEFLLPREKETYILRSCLIDAVGIERTQWDPVPVLGGNPIK